MTHATADVRFTPRTLSSPLDTTIGTHQKDRHDPPRSALAHSDRGGSVVNLRTADLQLPLPDAPSQCSPALNTGEEGELPLLPAFIKLDPSHAKVNVKYGNVHSLNFVGGTRTEIPHRAPETDDLNSMQSANDNSFSHLDDVRRTGW